MEDGKVTWQDYQRHNTRQAEKVVEFLERMETEAGVTAGQDRIFFTGSGAGFLAPLVGAKLIQEVVAVAACVERQHPDVRFVSEIGGEDMKTIFFTATGTGTIQAGLHAVGVQRRHRDLHREDRAQAAGAEREAGRAALRRHEPAQGLQQVRDLRRDRRQHAGEDRRAGRGDHRQPVRGGRLPEPGHADQGQHARRRKCCCSAAPTSSSRDCRRRGATTWPSCGRSGRSISGGREPAELIVVPAEALYYACLGCIEIGQGEKPDVGVYLGRDKLEWWVETGQHEAKAKEGAQGLITGAGDLATFVSEYVKPAPSCDGARAKHVGTVLLGLRLRLAPPPRRSCSPRTASCSSPATR